jgi:hypothetical protein
MTILEFSSLHLSVDGLVKALACDQRTIAKRPKDIGATGASGNESPLLGSNGSYWDKCEVLTGSEIVCFSG